MSGRNELARMLGVGGNPLSLGARKRPTRKHRPAVWENMLGTVYALDDDGHVKYFDYDYEAALAFAGVRPDRDLRTYRVREARRWTDDPYTSTGPRVGKLALWLR
jgi:hypothetical protein